MFNIARIRSTSVRTVWTQKRLEHTLPALAYAYDALEPHVSKEIMTLHHTKHHQTYVTGINAAEAAYAKLASANANDVSNLPLTEQIALQTAIKFNGGGHINHSLFWKNLSPEGGKLSDGNLKALVDRDFGGLDALKKEFNAKTAAIQGSGWGWLGYNKATKRIEIVTTANQDPLTTHVPLIGVDIWEHAFYLQYKNVKPDYLNAIWNVIDFTEAERRLAIAVK